MTMIYNISTFTTPQTIQTSNSSWFGTTGAIHSSGFFGLGGAPSSSLPVPILLSTKPCIMWTRPPKGFPGHEGTSFNSAPVSNWLQMFRILDTIAFCWTVLASIGMILDSQMCLMLSRILYEFGFLFEEILLLDVLGLKVHKASQD